jgi:hypothetical protein
MKDNDENYSESLQGGRLIFLSRQKWIFFSKIDKIPFQDVRRFGNAETGISMQLSKRHV